MVRDSNGYTPMLKAAALGRKDMVVKMVESGCDPRHIDPYGNKPIDKAILYNRYEVAEYLKEVEEKANKGMIKFINWKEPQRMRRSGRYLTYFDY